MNVQCSLIQELMLYEFKLDHNAAEATKKICGVKGEDVIDLTTVTRWLKKILLGSCRPKTVDSKLDISQSSVACHLHKLSKSIQIVPQITKIL